ncbi:predicted GPI-anchored protein 58 isoform X2 [Manduca sexta]|uniref:predicted GPI-anchored protein 58 isoform X2 n=1 Tax=Manduca sexta TaxID=7130 RepID=UPI0011824961|nr:predicted GPI-anchored protein 58 isoform X2 [Manduca sexta]
MKILPLFILFACVAWQTLAQEEGEVRPSSRGLLKRGLATRGKPTTTTTVAPQEDAEYDEEADYPAEGESPEPSTEAPPPSSTEGKKLVAGGVRPFRSNTDLLETLKRRRAQAAEAKARGPVSTEAAPAQDAPAESAKSSYSGKRRFNSAPAKEATPNEEAPAPAKPSRGRFASARSLDPEAEEQNDAAPPARNSRFSRQRGSSN